MTRRIQGSAGGMVKLDRIEGKALAVEARIKRQGARIEKRARLLGAFTGESAQALGWQHRHATT